MMTGLPVLLMKKQWVKSTAVSFCLHFFLSPLLLHQVFQNNTRIQKWAMMHFLSDQRQESRVTTSCISSLFLQKFEYFILKTLKESSSSLYLAIDFDTCFSSFWCLTSRLDVQSMSWGFEDRSCNSTEYLTCNGWCLLVMNYAFCLSKTCTARETFHSHDFNLREEIIICLVLCPRRRRSE